jgi:DNA mismatch repair protein MutL
VSVRYIADGKPQCHTPGDSRIDSCVYNLFGREFFAGLVEASTEDETVSVTGYVSAPSAARGNRSYQFFFVNGRPIRSRTLQAALEQAYANTLTSGRFPSCVLYITTRLCDVDVNVHPAKTEVKFVSDKQVFDGVYYATLGALGKLKATGVGGGGASPSGKNALAATSDDGIRDANRAGDGSFSAGDGTRGSNRAGDGSMLVGDGTRGSSRASDGSMLVGDGGYRGYNVIRSGTTHAAHNTDSPHHADSPHGKRPPSFAPPRIANETLADGDAVYRSNLTSAAMHRSQTNLFAAAPAESGDSPIAADAGNTRGGVAPYRVVGEVLDSYIVVEQAGSVLFIDKHAAHERIYFDALKAEGREPMSQTLLAPIVSHHGHEDMTLLLDNADLLDGLGFTVEAFGEDAVAIRRIPSEIDIDDAEPVLSDICAGLKLGSVGTAQRLEGIYRSIACKAAIKAGKASGMLELETLAARVMSDEIAHCPHGRPVVFAMPKSAFDREFKRT